MHRLSSQDSNLLQLTIAEGGEGQVGSVPFKEQINTKLGEYRGEEGPLARK